jgi:phospholipase D
MKKKQHNLTWIPHFIVHNSKFVPFMIVAFMIGYEARYFVFPPLQTVVQSPNLTCKVCFTPRQACLPLILEEIDKATTSIHMQAYSFTSNPIADALIRAHKRGVTIVVIADKSQRKEKYTQIHNVKRAGIAVYIDTQPAIAHNKIIIINQKTVISGSYNFLEAAEKRNAENVTVIQSQEIAKLYEDNFSSRLAFSEVYTSNG